MEKKNHLIAEQFLHLVQIMSKLRAPDGCPWDKKQTHDTLKKYMIEEAYELVESIDDKDDKALIEECGDVLLQAVFHAQIGQEEKRFTILDVLNTICEKLIARHPHVFGDREAHSAEEVLRNWESDKKKEKPERQSILEGIPGMLPALMQACQIQERASRVGFDWEKIGEVYDKFEEEWHEFRYEINASQTNPEVGAVREPPEQFERMKEEFGDLLFALVNISRYIHVDPEEALKQTNRKFMRRFLYIEKTMKNQNKSLEDASLEEMDALWEEAKKIGK